jgi:pyruvate dehydrogenase E1 component
MTKKLLVPDIGDFENVEVIELLVKEGQEIKQNDPVVTIESDKSSVEIPSTFSGKIDSILVKVGDKVSKGDLLLEITSSTQATQSLQDVPKKTENLIQEAENSLKKIKEKKIVIQNIKKEKPELIQVTNEGDIDPLETNEWLESLSEVIEKDGNQRAHYLIKELIFHIHKILHI